MQSPCFIALTRPVSFMGLPFTYVVLMALVVFGGFIATLSFIYLIVSALVSYVGLRALANYDPRIIDVALTSMSKTPVPPSWFRGEGMIYHA